VGFDRRLAACLEFLDAAHAWELGDDAWLRGLVFSIFRVWVSPGWACACEYDTTAGQFELGSTHFRGTTAVMRRVVINGLLESGTEMAKFCRTVSAGYTPALGSLDGVARRPVRMRAIELFGINGRDERSGRGCFIGIRAKRGTFDAQDMLLFEHLAAHLASAYRCRRRLRTPLVDPIAGPKALLPVPRPVTDALTERERHVVAGAIVGKSSKEIAYELGISDSTTRVLLGRAYRRLGVRSRTQLVQLAQARDRPEGGPES
jgi:DNA-binding CsgD family transcriptional regulator